MSGKGQRTRSYKTVTITTRYWMKSVTDKHLWYQFIAELFDCLAVFCFFKKNFGLKNLSKQSVWKKHEKGTDLTWPIENLKKLKQMESATGLSTILLIGVVFVRFFATAATKNVPEPMCNYLWSHCWYGYFGFWPHFQWMVTIPGNNHDHDCITSVINQELVTDRVQGCFQ